VKLDIVVPTRNRSASLQRLLDSIRDAAHPPDLETRVIVVDNASTDDTKDVVDRCDPIAGRRPSYVRETVLGRSAALNAGILAGDGDLVGFLDDDERIAPAWLTVVRDAFAGGTVDFISGPCWPDWGAPPPAWLPRRYPAVIGWIDSGDRVLTYGSDYDGIMMGGNSVVRRRTIVRVGLFEASLGRSGRKLTTGEDAEYFERLMAIGARGHYLPSLVIYHYVPPERLTKRYHRRWCFYRGISLARIERLRPQPVAHLLGVPRYLFGNAVRGIAGMARAATGRDQNPERAFTNELQIWDLAGFAYGRWVAGIGNRGPGIGLQNTSSST
jgi:glycosyltransferase involved in cell wall biosynthesis